MNEPIHVEGQMDFEGNVLSLDAIRKRVGEVEVTYATGWQCPECGLVWSPLFDGPCIHDSQGGTDVREIYRQS